MNMFSKKDISKIEETFYPVKNGGAIYIAEFQGERVRISSGKDCWITINAARSAMTTHFYYLNTKDTDFSPWFRDTFRNTSRYRYEGSKLRKELEKEGYLVFKKIML